MASPVFLIALDRASFEERQAVQAIVKSKSGWWHHFTDVWLVTGRTSDYWSKALQPALTQGRSSFLIVELPEHARHGGWVYYGVEADKRAAWLEKHL